ncbi:hypothetical protein FPV67DRAFT_1455888 [Lyophyllum atratum]|nr:hypothetical protein FPV67DRAFT_1455888 [Lyophyllum atratum]
MVSALTPFLATTTDDTKKLRGRVYAAHSAQAVSKVIHTQANNRARRPHLALIMGGQKLQPHIHDAIVVVREGERETQFHVFVKNHRYLPVNDIIAGWGVGMGWKGDIVVMRKGIMHDFVNMQTRDIPLADFAVRR